MSDLHPGLAIESIPTGGRAWWSTLAILAGSFVLSTSVIAEPQESRVATLGALDPFIGRWQGTTDGQPGKGTVEREYTPILNARFIQLRNRTTYPPQERNPKGEQHEDIGFFSADSQRQRLVLRQFHVEGFVNQYVAEASSVEQTLVLVTESIENIPPGWRARETYRLLGPDEFEEVFELAPPGKPFALYSRALLKRVR